MPDITVTAAPVAAAPVPVAPAPAAPPGFFFSDAQFTALVAGLKGQSTLSVIGTDAKAVGSDILSRFEGLISDLKAEAQGVHGAAKSVQADVKANWPLVVVGLIAIAALALQVVGLFGFKL
jgi:hypothetical protein